MPSVRSRLVSANALSMLRMSMPVSAVIWWTITSGFAASTARATEALSRPSMICGVGAERAQLAGLGLAAGGAGDGVAVLDQEGDQCTAGGARGACDEDVHGP